MSNGGGMTSIYVDPWWPVRVSSSEEVEVWAPCDRYPLQHNHGTGDQRKVVGNWQKAWRNLSS